MRTLSIFFLFIVVCKLVFAKEAILIGISGGTGSGKSTIAEKLYQAFPENSIIVC